MDLVVAGGRRLECEWIGPRPGEAPTIVFLHEGLGSVRQWGDFPAQLAEAAGCGALVYSRAGYGRSDPVPLPRPVRFMHHEAEVLGEVLDAFSISDAVLFGHSDGASIAIVHAGGAGAGRVRALVLEAPHVFTEPMGLESIARIRDAYATTRLRQSLARYHDHVDVAFRGWNDVWLDPDFRAWNIEEYLPSIRVPALLIQGESDEYGTMAQIDAIRRQVSGRVEAVVLPACGHAPHRDHPDTVLAVATEFIREVLRVSPSQFSAPSRETRG